MPTDWNPGGAGVHEYRVFRRTVRSTVRLPQLRSGDGTGGETHGPPIRVRRGDLAASPADVPASLTRVYADPADEFTIHEDPDGRLYWFYESVGTLRVSGGTDVVVSPAPSGRAGEVRWLVRNAGLRLALVQQGAVVVHASAVVVDGRAVAFTGPSGRGKSTAAGACVAAGHDLLVDDVLPCSLDDGVTVPPGYPSLGLDGTVARELGFEPAPEFDAVVRVDDRFCLEPRPLDTVYLLTDGDDVGVEPVSRPEAAFALLEASYALYDEDDSPAQATHLEQCGSVVERVPVCRLERPRSLETLDDLVAAVEADVSRG